MKNKRSKVFLSVVIPAYNEAENFEKGVLDQVERYFKKQEYPWKVVVVDDGSDDETYGLVKNFIKGKKELTWDTARE